MSTNIASRNSKTGLHHEASTQPHRCSCGMGDDRAYPLASRSHLFAWSADHGRSRSTDNMSGSFNHTPELTRQGVTSRARAEERLRKAIEIEKAENNELWDKAIAAELGAGTNDHTLESVH